MDTSEILAKFTEVLKSPEVFGFPFDPYPIQKDFMRKLYSAIENGKLGVFESPTGTGKSLSVICGSLAWLLDHERREKEALENSIASLSLSSSESNSCSDWIQAQAEQLRNQATKVQLQSVVDKISKRERFLSDIRKRNADKGSPKKKTFDKAKLETIKDEGIEKPIDEDSDLLLDDAKEKFDYDCSSDEDDEKEENLGVKIIFCSRTHSQLSQFVNEIKRTKYQGDVRVVPLASRQSYCINKTVRSLGSISLINEKCLEMQKKGKGKTTKEGESGERVKKSRSGSGPCPMLASSKRLGEDVAVRVNDVEDLVRIGQEQKACPYYASRVSANYAQLVVVPYNILLHKGTREASGLKLDGNIVIIDEAHNLLETISHIHSVHLNGAQLTQAYGQLVQYKDRYEKRFSAFNLMYLKQLIFVLGNIIKLLGGKPGCSANEATAKVIDSKIHSLTDFQLTAEIDNFNLYELIKFCKLSKITHKMQGFSTIHSPQVKINAAPQSGLKAFLKEITNKSKGPSNQKAADEPETKPAEEKEGGQPLVTVISFLECLTNHTDDGRVVVSRAATVGKSYVKYLLLNPSPTFKDIVDKARSVIVCGGTMEPISEFVDQLFLSCGAKKERILEFRCGHVIPPENILPIALAEGPTGKALDFSYQSRSSSPMMTELGRILTNVCQTVPGGVVCFFPSYDYEALVYQHFDKSGVIFNISKKKKVFREPKKSNQVEAVLSEYASIIKNAKKSSQITGCLLFSVVGGKLSEGLNFSDDLGRCVIVVGLPYPNIKSPELNEKMKYLDSNVGCGAGRSYYESLCMKAVNQCIGRAVRHRGDYATVLLLDSRYLRPAVQSQLPSWIVRSLQNREKFGPTMAQLVKFFKSHS